MYAADYENNGPLIKALTGKMMRVSCSAGRIIIGSTPQLGSIPVSDKKYVSAPCRFSEHLHLSTLDFLQFGIDLIQAVFPE
jgi:hypothetical protein